jgi:phosphoserine phosphatase
MNPFVATLICDPRQPVLGDALLARAAQALPAQAQVSVLAEAVAVDLVFQADATLDCVALASLLREHLRGSPVDVIVQSLGGRRKRLLLADMDSTMIEQECIDELADGVGLKPQVAAITERAMRGEIAFEPALRERVALLAGLPIGVVDRLLAERITLTPGGPVLVRTMRAHGAYTALVSGGFTLFTGPIAARIGFNEDRANRLLVGDGRFTGEIASPILGQEAKRAALIALREQLDLTRADSLAVGDGANDLAMLQDAGLGVAFRAKPVVAAAAHARLDHADLTALLYAQGYRRDEFVA